MKIDEQNEALTQLMRTIAEYRTIVAEFLNCDQQQVTMAMYRAEHNLPAHLIQMITDLSRFDRRTA